MRRERLDDAVRMIAASTMNAIISVKVRILSACDSIGGPSCAAKNSIDIFAKVGRRARQTRPAPAPGGESGTIATGDGLLVGRVRPRLLRALGVVAIRGRPGRALSGDRARAAAHQAAAQLPDGRAAGRARAVGRGACGARGVRT